jgi:hypothetical protein
MIFSWSNLRGLREIMNTTSGSVRGRTPSDTLDATLRGMRQEPAG